VSAPGQAAPLLDLRLAEASAFLPEPRLSRLGLQVSSFLCLTGLVLQRPNAHFSAERPRLPGQSHPGSGVYRRLRDRLLLWADDWGKDGLLSFPTHFHNAVLDAPLFRFLVPGRDGRLAALRSALAGLPLAPASWAVHEGRVADEAGGTFRWEPAETVAPCSDELRGWFASNAYGRLVEAARAAARFRL
jgi:hypothetical protein